jgi:ethanolamine ammonia-lyase small subunit
MADLRTLDWPADGLPRFLLHSQAADRRTYLQCPDLGRKLDESSRILLENFSASEGAGIFDLSIVFADGLSALAVERHAGPLLAQLLPLLAGVAPVLRMAPTSILEQARVAAGDEVAMALHASLVVVLIGERPGLSSPDSLGAYITWKPNSGTTDANRNCISNIRSEGLSYRDAAARLLYYIREAHRLEQTGIALKDPSDEVCQALLHTTRETLPAETGPSL